LDFADHAAAMAWCEAERATIMSLTRDAADRGLHEPAWRLPTTLWGYFSLRNRWADLVSTHEIALGAARAAGDRLGQAIALNNMGIAKANLGDLAAAHVMLDRALVLRKEIGDVWGQAAVSNNLGSLHRGRGEFNTAIAHHDRAIALFRQVGDRCGEGQALNNLGSAFVALGRLDEAIAYYQRALNVLFDIGDRLGQAETLDSLGSAYQVLADFDAAVDCHLRAALLFRELGDRNGEAGGLDNLGLALAGDGATALARDSWENALALFDEVDPARADTVRARLAGIDASVG
jgi:tetratricopeptide (TPR) repeat protein